MRNASAGGRTGATVIGLGSMGTALARALLGAGVPTTVWNRSAGRVSELASEGAAVADSPAAAVQASHLVIVCLRDHAAFRRVIGDLDPAAFAGRVVVHLSSATPDEARRTAAWAGLSGISYLNGAIMVPTPLIGTPEAKILYCGPGETYAAHAGTLAALGRGDHLGEDPGLASLYDVGMLEVFFAGMTSFLHAAAMLQTQGVEAETFLPYAQEIAAVLPNTYTALARDMDRGTYPGDEDNLAMELAALDHIVDTSQSTGVDARLPSVLRNYARAAVAAGHGGNGFSAVAQVLMPTITQDSHDHERTRHDSALVARLDRARASDPLRTTADR